MLLCSASNIWFLPFIIISLNIFIIPMPGSFICFIQSAWLLNILLLGSRQSKKKKCGNFTPRFETPTHPKSVEKFKSVNSYYSEKPYTGLVCPYVVLAVICCPTISNLLPQRLLLITISAEAGCKYLQSILKLSNVDKK